VLSKRRLIALVRDGHVKGWDDPRLPTIRGMRRRGYTADAINNFCDRIGVTRHENLINLNLLEQCIREDLDVKCNRALVVTEPLKVVITNFEGVKEFDIPNHHKFPERGTHKVPFSSVIYIEKSDFRLQDVKGYKRLAPNKEVGLQHVGFVLKCTEVIQDKEGNVVELKAVVDTAPKKKAQGYIHWVAEPQSGKKPDEVELRIYDKLFKSEQPAKIKEWVNDLNPNSLTVLSSCLADPVLRNAKVGDSFQFERIGFFCKDPDSTPSKSIWNRIVSLKEANWEK
jgi:glutaminyl-tRNA synthetase